MKSAAAVWTPKRLSTTHLNDRNAFLMADPSTAVIQLGAWLARSIGGSAALFGDFTSEHLGLELPAAVFQSAQVESALRGASTSAEKVGAAGAKLETEATSGDEVQILGAFIELG